MPSQKPFPKIQNNPLKKNGFFVLHEPPAALMGYAPCDRSVGIHNSLPRQWEDYSIQHGN